MIALLSLALAVAATPDAQAAKPVKEKKICRSEVATGSIMPTHTCHSAAEWEAIDKVNAQATEQYHNRSSQGAQPMGH